MDIKPTQAELEQSRQEHIAAMKEMGASQETLDQIRHRWERIDQGLPPERPEYILPIPEYGILTYATDNDHQATNQRILEIVAINPDANLIKYEALLEITIVDFEPTSTLTHDNIIGEIE